MAVHLAEDHFPVGAVCRALTVVRWEFAGCRNPDGGPVEIGWETGQTTCLDASPSGDIMIRTVIIGDSARADGDRAVFRQLSRPSLGRWHRDPVAVGNPLAGVLGQTLIGVRSLPASRGRTGRVIAEFTGGAALSVQVFRAEIRVEVRADLGAADAAVVTTCAPPSSWAKHVHRVPQQATHRGPNFVISATGHAAGHE